MSQWKLLDFECPVHGKFEVLTDKRDGEPVVEPCPGSFFSDWQLANLGTLDIARLTPHHIDARCDSNGRPLCGFASPVATTNAVNWHMKRGEVSRGKNDTALPPHILSTEALADGMPMDEWKSIQSDKANDERLKLNREMVS